MSSSPFPLWEINRFFYSGGESSLCFLRLNKEGKQTPSSVTAVVFIVLTGLLLAVTHPWQSFWTVTTELGQIS